MKTVKNKQTDEIIRVSNERAFHLVNSGKWTYCPKSEWKIKVRDNKEAEGKQNAI